MVDENPLEGMLNQLADLFKIIEESKGKSISERVTPEIRARLDHVRELVDKFSELNTKVFDSVGLKQDVLNQIIKNSSPNLSQKNKKILEFSKKLKAEVETARLQLSVEKKGETLMYNQDKQKAEEIAKRKKKFKRLGGDNWLPL